MNKTWKANQPAKGEINKRR